MFWDKKHDISNSNVGLLTREPCIAKPDLPMYNPNSCSGRFPIWQSAVAGLWGRTCGQNILAPWSISPSESCCVVRSSLAPEHLIELRARCSHVIRSSPMYVLFSLLPWLGLYRLCTSRSDCNCDVFLMIKSCLLWTGPEAVAVQRQGGHAEHSDL